MQKSNLNPLTLSRTASAKSRNTLSRASKHQWRVECNTPYRTASASSPRSHPISWSHKEYVSGIQSIFRFLKQPPSTALAAALHRLPMPPPTLLSSPLRFTTSMLRRTWAAPTPPLPPTPLPVFRYARTTKIGSMTINYWERLHFFSFCINLHHLRKVPYSDL